MVTADRGEPDALGPARAVRDHGMDAYAVAADGGSGLVYRQGGHVAEWAPAGSAPVLWTSAASAHALGVPFRGGIPLCAPWFGNGADGTRQPLHGWARVRDWRLREASSAGGSARLRFTSSSPHDEPSGPGRDPDLDLELVVRLGAGLTLELGVTNRGPREAVVEVAMHAYWAVTDARRASVTGLDGAPFVDRAGGSDVVAAPQAFPALTGQEVNRVYPRPEAVTIHDPGAGRDVRVSSPDAAQVVVWNPGAENARRAADLRDDDWTRFVCVEVANVRERSLRVEPGRTAMTTLHAEVVGVGG